jgi:hypothetical protein
LKARRTGKTIQKIIDEECRKRGISKVELKGGGKRRKVSDTRALIAMRSRAELGLTSAAIARHVGVNTSAISRAIEDGKDGGWLMSYLESTSPKIPKQKIERARQLLAKNRAEQKQPEEKAETWQERLFRLTGFDVARCPNCGERAMRTVETIMPARCKGPPRI